MINPSQKVGFQNRVKRVGHFETEGEDFRDERMFRKMDTNLKSVTYRRNSAGLFTGGFLGTSMTSARMKSYASRAVAGINVLK